MTFRWFTRGWKIWPFHEWDKSREGSQRHRDLCFHSCPLRTGHCLCSGWPCCSKCVISPSCRLMSASNICVRLSPSKWEVGGARERDARSARKTTLSKEGFKDYQLRLLGNLQSCILSTSKSRCALEYCKWESEGCGGGGAVWGGICGGWGSWFL